MHPITALLLLTVCAGSWTAVVSIPIRTPKIVTIHQQWNDSARLVTTKVCRGTVIDRVRVVTVASCVYPVGEGVDYIVKGVCRSKDRRVTNVTVHPSADLALLYVDDPIPVNGTLIGLTDTIGKPSGVASLDTTSGLQKVPILDNDPCSSERQQSSQDVLYIPSMCDTTPGSPLFQVHNNQPILIGLVSSIPEPCNGTPCQLHLTDISRQHRWLSEQSRDEAPPSIKLPKIPATVVFSFLKLLAVVSSLGGVSFAFCCVMFLISN